MPLDASTLAKDTAFAAPVPLKDAKPMIYGSLVLLAVVIAIVILKLAGKLNGKKIPPTSLTLREYKPFKLIQKTDINHNTMSFRFALPSAEHCLGLPVGKHVSLKFTKGEEDVYRSYTPVTSDDTLGYFDLVIKIYEQGKMGQYLKHLALNATVDMRGPNGALSYLGGGKFEIARREEGKSVVKTYNTKNVGLIAGGTGLTPMLQIIRDVVKNPADTTNLSFIFANVTEGDILLRKELEDMAERHPNFKCYFTLDRPADDWKQGRGFVTDKMITERMPDADLVLVCGPPPMCKAQESNLKKIGKSDDQLFIYT